jgi:hypothetical protein
LLYKKFNFSKYIKFFLPQGFKKNDCPGGELEEERRETTLVLNRLESKKGQARMPQKTLLCGKN